MLLRSYKKNRNVNTLLASQVKYVFYASLVLPISTIDYIPKYGIEFYPFGWIFIVVFSIITAYAIVKHQLMDITVAITRATVFTIVYGSIFGLPIVFFILLKQQFYNLYVNYPWSVPMSFIGYAALATISPFVYIKLEKKAYLAIFGDYTIRLQILTETSRDIIDRGFENALELAQRIPTHITNFYEETMGQKLRHAVYLLREGTYFTLYHGKVKYDKHNEGEKISQEDPIIKWFIKVRDQMVHDKLIKHTKKSVLEKEELKAIIDDLSRREKYTDLRKELTALYQAMESMDSTILFPSYYKDELMGILALGEKQKGFYRPEEIVSLQRLAENAAMVFKGSQLTASVIEAENIKKLEKAKSEFFANVSHELRTPLTNIILPIQNVLEKIGHKISPENREEKESILRNAHRLLKRINEILDISKLESGKMQIEARLRDVNSILEDIVAASSIGAKERGISLLFKPDNNIPPIYLDTEKIEKVFANLLSNALKFTNPQGKVEIRTREEADHLEVIVSDTGIGIAQADIPHIFERFRQLDGSSSRKYEGTGIGLSLVKELVELHHGSIEVTSELNKGTTFTVRLLKGRDHFQKDEIREEPEKPHADNGFAERRIGERRKADRREADRRKMSAVDRVSIDLLQLQFSDMLPGRALPQPAHKAAGTAHGNGGLDAVPAGSAESGRKGMILIVDDNRDLAANIAHCFSPEHRVSIAYDGTQALETIGRELPSLVISDVMMPEMDGYELCERIKSGEQTQHIPVILLTAKAAVEDRITGLKHGADEYLAKPFNAKELLAVVDSLLIKMELQAQLNRTNQELKKALYELKETEAELVHTAKLASVGQLAAGVAHEIHNPASAIDNCLQIIAKRVEKVTSSKATFGEIYPDLAKSLALGKSSLSRVQNIVDSLLGFSRKNREGLNFVDIHTGINDTLSLLEHQCRGMIQIHKEFRQIEKIEVDLQQINQVFMNLLSNAIHAIEDKREKGAECGNIWISTGIDGEEAIIKIKDDGIGIPKDILDKIFDPFFTTKELGKGTGLGLNISYRIIKNHNGAISVDSTENEGTTFTLKIPARRMAQRAARGA